MNAMYVSDDCKKPQKPKYVHKCSYRLSTICSNTFFPVWYDSPTVTVLDTMTYPIEELTFPTVTVCPQNSNPDRWGATIKAFDHLDKKCPGTG